MTTIGCPCRCTQSPGFKLHSILSLVYPGREAADKGEVMRISPDGVVFLLIVYTAIVCWHFFGP